MAEHGALVGTNAAGQCLLKLVLLLPQTLLGQLTESDRIVLALDQPLQHGPAAGPHDVAGPVTQLDVGPLQHLLDPLHVVPPLLHPDAPITAQLPELVLLATRNDPLPLP